jgi:hypothetical protein
MSRVCLIIETERLSAGLQETTDRRSGMSRACLIIETERLRQGCRTLFCAETSAQRHRQPLHVASFDLFRAFPSVHQPGVLLNQIL